MGDDMKAAMKEYQNSLETMSSEAVDTSAAFLL